jgi:transposase
MPRAKRPDLNPQMRGRILELHSLGYSYQFIATEHNLPRSTVQTTVRNAQIRPETQEFLPRKGAPRVIIEEQRDHIFDTIQQNPTIARTALRDQEAPNASVRTLRQLLHNMHFRKWIRLKRPALNERRV